jgi:hypothetical protein
MSQTDQNFTWILFFDVATPMVYSQRALELVSRRPRTHAIFCNQLPLDRVISEVKQKTRGVPSWLITTRIDNDDGLHEDFVSTVQNSIGFTFPEVINIPLGIVVSDQKTYIQRHFSNAFISLAEPYLNAQTVFSISRHNQARKNYPVRQVGITPMWMQVIHSNNISNRIKGWRVRSSTVRAGFVAIKSQSEIEASLEIFIENITLGVFRILIDMGIIFLKAGAAMLNIELRRTVKGVSNARKSHNEKT